MRTGHPRRLPDRAPRRDHLRRCPDHPGRRGRGGHREDGVVDQQLFSLTVNATPGNIPNSIEVDISDLERRRRRSGSATSSCPTGVATDARSRGGHRRRSAQAAAVVEEGEGEEGEAAEGEAAAEGEGGDGDASAEGGVVATRPRSRPVPRRPRVGTPADLLVVGLGNPGAEYAGTRHNVGADVVALLAARHGERLKRGKERALTAEARVGGKRVALAFPQTYMNESGLAVAPLVRRYGIDDLEQLVIVHDELDLPVGRLKVKVGGGLAGHNGLKSIDAHLKSDGFVRVRIGVGKPPGKQHGADHVLKPPGKAERQELDIVIEEAADAVEMILDRRPRCRDEPVQRPSS